MQKEQQNRKITFIFIADDYMVFQIIESVMHELLHDYTIEGTGIFKVTMNQNKLTIWPDSERDNNSCIRKITANKPKHVAILKSSHKNIITFNYPDDHLTFFLNCGCEVPSFNETNIFKQPARLKQVTKTKFYFF